MKLFFRIIFQVAFIITILSGCESDELLNLGSAFYIDRGIAYTEKGKYDKAIDEFNKAIKINPKFAEAYSFRGIVYGKKGQYDRAIDDFTEAIEINPKFAEAYSNRGFGYMRKGQYDRAIDDFTEAIEINPKFAQAYMFRGSAYIALRQYDKYTSDFNKAKELDPSYDKRALLEKNEDLLSVIAKSIDFSQPEVDKEIYTDNAILKYEDARTGRMHKFKGFKEIENWRKERGKKWPKRELYVISIEREADRAHVKCGVLVDDVETGAEFIKLSCSTKMLKIGSTWKIKEQIIMHKY